MNTVIEATELSRWYGIVMGLNNVSFRVGPGLTGLVGPNGAGKSTLIQIITGQLQPSSGELLVFGETPWNNPRLLRRVGYCPERESLPVELRPADWLRGLALISGMSLPEARRRGEAMLDRVGLAREHWRKRMGQYSKGMRQRVKLAQALMHDPDLLVLDEPMNGLDPMGRQEVANILKELARKGTGILISSHILAELETLCGSNLILNWGRIIASGAQGDIRTAVKDWSEQLAILCDQPETLARALFNAGVLNGFDLKPNSELLVIRIKDAETFYPQWTRILLASGVTVYEVRGQSRSLQDIFEKVTA
ncbi:MAG: ABC transporter ATP-binding protein [Verrucomicrobiae bacterium]|jgi:ABC-2 type transport system ATP-binding protein|nr:ABC transporter ATP-binding protein [Verrucomicrobiae bacterium]